MRLGRTGLGHRPHCSASRLRSGSLTRLRSATKRSNQPQIPQGEIRNTLTNLFQDLTCPAFLRSGWPLQFGAKEGL